MYYGVQEQRDETCYKKRIVKLLIKEGEMAIPKGKYCYEFDKKTNCEFFTSNPFKCLKYLEEKLCGALNNNGRVSILKCSACLKAEKEKGNDRTNSIRDCQNA
jgi:hypothetical protein